MSKRPVPPPPGDKPVRTAPPPPPRWRHWLWPVTLIVMLLLYTFLPALHGSASAQLSYSQFSSDASAHKIKTVTFESGASGSNTVAFGDLTNGKSYTTVIPGQATTEATANAIIGLAQLPADREAAVRLVTPAPASPSAVLNSQDTRPLGLAIPILG